jgi:septal ring factor EnvC (AmiA/AmiB activator)
VSNLVGNVGRWHGGYVDVLRVRIKQCESEIASLNRNIIADSEMRDKLLKELQRLKAQAKQEAK